MIPRSAGRQTRGGLEGNRQSTVRILKRHTALPIGDRGAGRRIKRKKDKQLGGATKFK